MCRFFNWLKPSCDDPPKQKPQRPSSLGLAARAQIDIGSHIPLAKMILNLDGANDKSRASFSSVGLFNIHRYYFLDDEARRGQVAQVISVAPNETLEVVTQMTRRTSREDEYESSQEDERTSSTQTKDLQEITDAVSRSLVSASNSSTSAAVSGSVGSLSHSAGSSSSESVTSQHATRVTKEVIKSVADRMKRSVRIKVRNVQEITEANSARRQITNNSTKPVNIAVRTAQREEGVYVQAKSTQLYLGLTILKPGELLATSSTFQTPEPPEPVVQSHRVRVALRTWPEPTHSIPPGQDGQLKYDFELMENEELDFSKFVDESGNALTGPGFNFVELAAIDRRSTNPVDTAGWVAPDRLEVIDHIGGDRVTFRLTIPRGTLQPNVGGGNYEDGISTQLKVKLYLRLKTVSQNTDVATWVKSRTSNIESKLRVLGRSPQVLREEERIVVSKQIHAAIKALSPHDDLQSAFDFSSLWYSVEDRDLAIDVDPKKSPRTFSQTTDSKPAPFGYGLGWEGNFSAEADKLRNMFLHAEELKVFLPIRQGDEGIVQSAIAAKLREFSGLDGQLLNDFSSRLEEICRYLQARASAADRWRNSDGTKLDSGDVDLRSRIAADTDLRGLFREATYAKENGSAAELFPLVDKFSVVAPVDGVFYDLVE